MSLPPDYLLPSTPEASAAQAQNRQGRPAAGPRERASCRGEDRDFIIGPGVERAARARAYEHKRHDPVYRPLRIYALDPSVSKQQGAVALVNVPYEPLEAGPTGMLLQVDDRDDGARVRYHPANLETPAVLIRDGYDPSLADPQFHQQMVYAVGSLVYAAFRKALGRQIAWGFDRLDDTPRQPARLIIKPHACYAANAWYDKEQGELCFGYYRATKQVAGRNLPRGYVFTCLSHDIVAHEMTHALLDGLRAQLDLPSRPDTLAFHEAFADLVAIFQHFSYPEVVRAAIGESRGNLANAALITDIARQFGHTTGSARPLRSAIEVKGLQGRPTLYNVDLESHKLGSVLVSAVFEAFLTLFMRKTETYRRLATGGSGILPPGALPADLQEILAKEASQLANQFLTICIRAIDYCPPVDLEFEEFLRAVITADYDLVPDDPLGYREAWIDAFQRRAIYPTHVQSLSEDALLWRPPEHPVPCVPELTFAELRFAGDPGQPAGPDELRRQARALGRLVTRLECLAEFGLVRAGDACLGNDIVERPRVESIRTSRRVGPDGQVLFDLVAEVTQRRIVHRPDGTPEIDFYGGATVILGPQGEVRYVIRKSILDETRLQRQRGFVTSRQGARFWQAVNGKYLPRPKLFRLLHDEIKS